MTTLYPNIIYHADTSTEIFIDTLQAIDNTANADVVTYQSSVDGSLGTFNRGIGARQLTLNGKISEDNETELRRQLQYLRGKQVYLMLGARNIATLARIKSFDMPVSVGTYTPLALDVVCEGSSEGQFWEAEDNLNNGATAVSDSLATSGQAAKASSQWKGALNTIVQSDIVLPAGDYTMFYRARDTNQVTDDLYTKIYNYTDSTDIAYDSFTASSTYGIFTLDFTIDSADVGDSIQMYVQKGTTTTNDVYLDYLGFVRTD
jgi:hypothetical protein